MLVCHFLLPITHGDSQPPREICLWNVDSKLCTVRECCISKTIPEAVSSRCPCHPITQRTLISESKQEIRIFNKAFFVIADRIDWATSYILAVDLNYEGFVDAARIQASVAGDAIPSCSLMNTDWWEFLGRMTGYMDPKGAFVVYISPAIVGREERGLLAALNAGIESRKEDASVAVCRTRYSIVPAGKEIDG